MSKTITAPPQRTWIFCVAVAAGVLAYVLLIFMPGQRATAELRKQLIEQQQYVLQSVRLDAQIAQVEKELGQARDFTSHWHAASPTEERLAHEFLKITEHANRSGAMLVRFEPQPVESLDYLRRVPLELALEGSFSQVFDFLSRIESLDAEFWINRLQLDPVPATKGRLRCELQLVLFAGQPKDSD
jgi:Tfp pilus assembly protein PilO